MSRTYVRSAIVAGTSAALLYGLYLLLVYPPPLVELAVGAGAAGIAAIGGAVAYTTLWPGYRFGRDAAAGAARLPVQLLRDLVVVTGVLAGALGHRERVRGRTRWMPFDVAGGEKRVRGRRAATAVLKSFAPNTVVVGFDRSGEKMLVHELRPTPDADGDPP